MVDQQHFPNLDESDPDEDIWDFPIKDQRHIPRLLRRVANKYISLDRSLTFKIGYFFWDQGGIGRDTFDQWFSIADLDTPLASRIATSTGHTIVQISEITIKVDTRPDYSLPVYGLEYRVDDPGLVECDCGQCF